MLCYAMLCYAMLCCAMLCYAAYTMLCYAMLCDAMLCDALRCDAMLCYAMLCYAMRCYAVIFVFGLVQAFFVQDPIKVTLVAFCSPAFWSGLLKPGTKRAEIMRMCLRGVTNVIMAFV